MLNDNLDYTKIATGIITKHTGDIIKSIGSITKSKLADISIETQTAFISYIHQCVERFSNVKTLISRTIPTPLYDIYVHNNLSLSEYGVPPTHFTSNNINDLFDISSKIMILGSGGTGKSTLFKHLFLNTIKETDKIPIFITLREINNTDFNLMDFIYKSMSTFHFTLDKEYLFKSFNTGIYVFFFDGLDEIEENKKENLIKEINYFSVHYNKNHFIISSRSSDSFSGGWDGYTDLEVCPFDLTQAYELVNKLSFDREITGKFLGELDRLYTTHTSFCSNPLLLTLMLMTFAEYADIPNKIHSFYSSAYDVLYSRHDASKLAFKRRKKTDKNDLTYDSFKKILEAFSAIGYLENKISFKKDVLIDNINRARKLESINLNDKQINFVAEDFKDDLIESVCMLYVEGLEYTYVHRSFQEFFTANYINRQASEAQTKWLKKIVDTKKSSIVTDQVLLMLLDMNKIMVEKQLILPFLKSLKEDMHSLSASEYFDSMKYHMNSNYSLSLEINTKNQLFIKTDLLHNHYLSTASSTQILLLFIQSFYTKTDVSSFTLSNPSEVDILFATDNFGDYIFELESIGLSLPELNDDVIFIQKTFDYYLNNPPQTDFTTGISISLDHNIFNKIHLEKAIKPYKKIFVSSLNYCMNLLETMSAEHEKHQLLENDLI